MSSRITSFTVDGVLAKMLPALERYLLSEEGLPVWEPPPSWFSLPTRGDDEMQRVKTLRMLRMTGSSQRYYFPDMLLYGLGELETLDPEYAERRTSFVSGDHHIFLCNASGTGKTRLLFETLAHHWGLFFTCSWSDLYGASDLDTLLGEISSDSLFTMELDLSNPKSESLQLNVHRNHVMASHYIRSLILARLLVLDRFCGLVVQHKIEESIARRKWLRLQIRPHDAVNSDYFDRLTSLADSLTGPELIRRIDDLSNTHKSKLKFVAIDEAQVALNLLPKSFVRSDGKEHAPVFLELISVVADLLPSSRLIASGTEYGLDLMQEAINGSTTESKGVRFFHDLGSFRTKERVHAYMSHFLGSQTASKYSSLAYTWFRGRHRLLALLVMCTLMAGDDQLKTVLDTLVLKLTEYRPSKLAPINEIPISTAISDKRYEVFSHPNLLRDAVVTFVDSGRSFFSTTAVHELVTLGVAQYCNDPTKGEIFEPLLLLSICRWLMRTPKFKFHDFSRRRLTDESIVVRGPWFLRGLAACLAQVVPLPGAALRDYLKFAGREPQWAAESAELVLPQQDYKGRLTFRAVTAHNTLVHVSHDANDVLQWFKSAERPFLIPDPAFGPDMVFFVRIPKKKVVLACIHLPVARASRRVTQHVPVDPDYFYRKMPSVGKTVRNLLHGLSALSIPARSAQRTKIARFSVIQILCFAGPVRSGEFHDPPVAALRFGRLLEEPCPTVVEISQVVSVM